MLSTCLPSGMKLAYHRRSLQPSFDFRLARPAASVVSREKPRSNIYGKFVHIDSHVSVSPKCSRGRVVRVENPTH